MHNAFIPCGFVVDLLVGFTFIVCLFCFVCLLLLLFMCFLFVLGFSC